MSTRADTGVHTQSTTSSSAKSYRSTRNSTSDATSLTKEINSGTNQTFFSENEFYFYQVCFKF